MAEAMRRTGPGFTVLYRWRLHAGSEAAFIDAWSRLSELLLARRGSLGSRLHRGRDGVWYSYAQWPSAEARDDAFALPSIDPQAAAAMRAAIAESLPEIVLESVADCMILPPRDDHASPVAVPLSRNPSMNTALLVIDVQHALCTGAYAAFDIERVIATINAVSAQARSTGAPVVLVQHEDDGPLAFGTEGWQLAPGLATHADDLRVRKTAADSFHRTELHRLLQERGITRLVVCGLQSDFCVDTTVRRALSLGYDVVLVADGHSTLDNDALSAAQITAHHNATLKHLTSFGPRMQVMPAADLRIAA
jgi:nicotinamidase-related amidase